jgi:hypothetical protein
MATKKEWYEMFEKRAKELEVGGEFTYRYYGGKYVYKFKNDGQTPDSAKEYFQKYTKGMYGTSIQPGMATFLVRISVLLFVGQKAS